MSDELAKLEAERLRLIDMAHADERRRHFTSSTVAIVAVVVIGFVILFLVSAIWTGQLSVVGLFGSALAAALLYFILSRKILRGTPTATVADLAFSLWPARSNDAIQTKITEYEIQIARLKAGENK